MIAAAQSELAEALGDLFAALLVFGLAGLAIACFAKMRAFHRRLRRERAARRSSER